MRKLKNYDPDIPEAILADEDIIIFVDMDGTIAQWIPTSTPEEVAAPGYFRSLPAYDSMVRNIRFLVENGYEVYSLSAYMETRGDPVAEKKAWLDKFIPEIDEEHRLFCPCTASKWETVARAVGTEKTLILLDDYSVNLRAWESDSHGAGIGIKVMNGLNGTQGTWTGKRIVNTCSPEELIQILEGRRE